MKSRIAKHWNEELKPVIRTSGRELDIDIKKESWPCNTKRPNADAKMLIDLVFKEVQTVSNLGRKLAASLNYLKNGYSGEQFLVAGVK